MNLRLSHLSIFLLLAFGASLASAERIQFQRKKFDRSRFKRPDPTAPMAVPAPSEPVTAAEPAATAEEAPRAEPTGSSEFSSWKNTRPTNDSGGAIFSANPSLPSGPPPQNYFPGATAEQIAVINAPLFDEVPNKWFKKAKQFEELQELQKKTGACMILYFKNPTIPNEKGLCNWFEKTVTRNMKWRKAMRSFIKLEITLPGSKATRTLRDEFRAMKTPTVMVVQPGMSRGTRINLFDFAPRSRPEPKTAEEVLASVKAACTPAYETLF